MPVATLPVFFVVDLIGVERDFTGSATTLLQKILVMKRVSHTNDSP
jgi:hypothetical protein